MPAFEIMEAGEGMGWDGVGWGGMGGGGGGGGV